MYVCFFIVCFGFRWQQRTFSNTYHSSVAYERSTGDPAIGLGFGAAALRSNVSYICLLVYISHTSFSDLLSNKIKRLDRRKELNSVTRHISDLSFFLLSSYLIFHFFFFFFVVTRILMLDTAVRPMSRVPPGSRWLKKKKKRTAGQGGGRRQSASFYVKRLGATWDDFTYKVGTFSILFLSFFFRKREILPSSYRWEGKNRKNSGGSYRVLTFSQWMPVEEERVGGSIAVTREIRTPDEMVFVRLFLF